MWTLERSSLVQFRVRFMLLVCLAMTPLFVLTLRATGQARELASTRERNNVLRWARLLASDHQRLVGDAAQLLLVLARVPVVQRGEKVACRALFERLLADYPQYATLALALPDGEVLASAARADEARAWIRERILARAHETGTLVTGPPRFNGGAQLPTVFLAQPVDGVDQDAILFASVELRWMERDTASTELPEGATATVWDSAGVIVGRHPDPGSWLGKDASGTELFHAIRAANGQGTAEVVGLDGLDRLYAFLPLSRHPTTATPGAVLSLGIPIELAFAEVRSIERSSLIILSAVTLLALAAAWLGGDRLLVRWFGQVVDVAHRDGLTGLLRRGRILALGEAELDRARRFGHPFAALLIDVDCFKEINDRCGHATGDAVLREIASRCAASVRSLDLAGRYGGDEFILILPESGPTAAKDAAERLRLSVCGSPISTRRGPIDVTLSIGVAVFQRGPTTLGTIIEAADRALYAAKDAGRNRVAMAESLEYRRPNEAQPAGTS